MLIGQIMIPLKRSWVLFPKTRTRFYSRYPSEQIDEFEQKQNVRKLKKWYGEKTEPNNGVLAIFNSNKQLPRKDDSFDFIRPKIKGNNFKSWYKAKQRGYLKWSQRFIIDRHQTLGNDLATTHFVLYRGGKVKQKGIAEYLKKEDLDTIPNRFDPSWLIDEIDMSNSNICYEGLDNFKNLRTLRKMSFKGCKYFDDWCLEKIVCQCPDIEYLDVSDCENITERGIEGLYRSWYLKKLVVTDYGHGAAFELTCLMLEDCMPGLQVEIIKAPINK